MCVEKTSFNLLVKTAKEKCPSLKNVVMFDAATPEQRQQAKEANLTIIDYVEVLETGRKSTGVVFEEP